MDEWSICERWQFGYCAGSPMPKYFRQIASEYFSMIFKDEREERKNFKYFGKTIYRAVIPPDSGSLIKFDNLYYSFSKNVDGLKQVVIKDKCLRSDIFIIEAQPLDAVDFQVIVNNLFGEFPKNRYYKENEVVSKLTIDSIISIYFLSNANDILDYKNKGTPIDKKSCQLKPKSILKKINLTEVN